MSFAIESAYFGRNVSINASIGKKCDEPSPVASLICGQGRGSNAYINTGQLSLLFCISGDLHIIVNGQVIILSEGHLWINADQDMRISSVGDAHWVGICCTGDTYQSLIDENNQIGLCSLTSLECMDESAEMLCQSICNESKSQHSSHKLSYDIVNYIAKIICQNSERIWKSPGRTSNAKRLSFQRLLKARNKIAIDPFCINTIHDLAAQASYSEWHFIRLFHRVFGETPMEYSQRLRLNRAKHLLKCSKMSVSEIARSSGYETFSAFCRSFRNHYGINASAIRSQAA